MRKIIFLDIDGVIATPESLNNGDWGLVHSKQLLLKEILDAHPEAELVISSSWRIGSVKETKEYMTEQGFLFSDKITGITIRAYHYIDKKEKIHLSIPRGVEIQQWIDTNIHSDNGKNFVKKQPGIDYNYIIIDDDSDMLLSQSNHFLQTSSDIGLTKEIVEKSIKKLNYRTFSKEDQEKIQELIRLLPVVLKKYLMEH